MKGDRQSTTLLSHQSSELTVQITSAFVCFHGNNAVTARSKGRVLCYFERLFIYGKNVQMTVRDYYFTSFQGAFLLLPPLQS
jgi:hypothetical protein